MMSLRFTEWSGAYELGCEGSMLEGSSSSPTVGWLVHIHNLPSHSHLLTHALSLVPLSVLSSAVCRLACGVRAPDSLTV